MKKRSIIVFVALALLAGFVAWAFTPSARRTIAGHIVRWCCGEPGATQGVNDAADIISERVWVGDLTAMAEALLAEFTVRDAERPESFMGGTLLPIDRLPIQYRQLGGSYSWIEPELALRRSPGRIVIDWAHMRHSITIYAALPETVPTGFHVRKVHDRVYVVARES